MNWYEFITSLSSAAGFSTNTHWKSLLLVLQLLLLDAFCLDKFPPPTHTSYDYCSSFSFLSIFACTHFEVSFVRLTVYNILFRLSLFASYSYPCSSFLRVERTRSFRNTTEQKFNMATEAISSNSESIEALSREAEVLKAKLEDEKAKLNDVDSKFGQNFSPFIFSFW